MAQVLVVDDNYGIRLMLSELLEDAGHDVLEAINGEAAMGVQRRHHVDLVICDILMPEKDGMSTIRDLTNEFPELRIIAMSGGDERLGTPENFVALAKRFGARATLTKPFALDHVLAMVNQVLCED